jgi:hypothetical protein
MEAQAGYNQCNVNFWRFTQLKPSIMPLLLPKGKNNGSLVSLTLAASNAYWQTSTCIVDSSLHSMFSNGSLLKLPASYLKTYESLLRKRSLGSCHDLRGQFVGIGLPHGQANNVPVRRAQTPWEA